MYPREDEQQRGDNQRIRVPVAFEFVTDTVVGDFEITNLDVYAQYQGDRVDEVPEGAGFEIHADYLIKNNNPTTLFPLWTTCMTVYNVTEGKREGYDTFGEHTGGGTKDAHDAINATGPSQATTYRVKIFANQKQGAGAPPNSQW
jgi:hypothetical protein